MFSMGLGIKDHGGQVMVHLYPLCFLSVSMPGSKPSRPKFHPLAPHRDVGEHACVSVHMHTRGRSGRLLEGGDSAKVAPDLWVQKVAVF